MARSRFSYNCVISNPIGSRCYAHRRIAVSETLNQTQAKGEAANEILSRKSRGERVTWVSRLSEPGINTALQPAGKSASCCDRECRAPRERSDPPRNPKGWSAAVSACALPGGLPAPRTAPRRRLAGLDGPLRRGTAGRQLRDSGGTAGRRRRDGYPKCLVPLCLPPAEPPGLKVWIGGLGAGGAGI